MGLFVWAQENNKQKSALLYVVFPSSMLILYQCCYPVVGSVNTFLNIKTAIFFLLYFLFIFYNKKNERRLLTILMLCACASFENDLPLIESPGSNVRDQQRWCCAVCCFRVKK